MDMYEFDHRNVIKAFKGQCTGVVLENRKDWENPNDPHVCFFLIVEDDGNWFESKTGHTSSYWIDDTIEQLQIARDWMNEYCRKIQHGWEFDKL